MVVDDPAKKALEEKPLETKPAPKGDGKTMHVKVYSPRRVFFDEDAESISGANATGAFDILALHHNFITLLSPCSLVIRRTSGRDPQYIKITGGLMHVKADNVTV